MENPEILVRDEKMQKLDSIVCEVKESEEWEAVRMSIFSVALEQGFARGEEIGKEIGKEQRCIEQICKKLCKGKTVELIAEELEEDVETIKKLCIIAEKYAPEYDREKIFEEWLQVKENA